MKTTTVLECRRYFRTGWLLFWWVHMNIYDILIFFRCIYRIIPIFTHNCTYQNISENWDWLDFPVFALLRKLFYIYIIPGKRVSINDSIPIIVIVLFITLIRFLNFSCICMNYFSAISQMINMILTLYRHTYLPKLINSTIFLSFLSLSISPLRKVLHKY